MNRESGRLPTRIAIIVLPLAVLLLVACGGGRRAPIGPGPAPATPPPPSSAVQQMYEAGRYREVVSRATAGTSDAATIWYAAQSHVRLGERDQAAQLFTQLATNGGTQSWQLVSSLALARLADDPAELDRLRSAAASLDPFVQFELGLAHARRNDFAAAARAFDRALEANPRFAYAYYNAGLVYNRLNRADLTILRLEMFERLAPEAPERPEVVSILRTVRR